MVIRAAAFAPQFRGRKSLSQRCSALIVVHSFELGVGAHKFHLLSAISGEFLIPDHGPR
jgi:hypothetical protein